MVQIKCLQEAREERRAYPMSQKRPHPVGNGAESGKCEGGGAGGEAGQIPMATSGTAAVGLMLRGQRTRGCLPPSCARHLTPETTSGKMEEAARVRS